MVMIPSVIFPNIFNISLHRFAHSGTAAVVVVDQHGKFQQAVLAGIEITAQRDHAVQRSCFCEDVSAVAEVVIADGAGFAAGR